MPAMKPSASPSSCSDDFHHERGEVIAAPGVTGHAVDLAPATASCPRREDRQDRHRRHVPLPPPRAGAGPGRRGRFLQRLRPRRVPRCGSPAIEQRARRQRRAPVALPVCAARSTATGTVFDGRSKLPVADRTEFLPDGSPDSSRRRGPVGPQAATTLPYWLAAACGAGVGVWRAPSRWPGIDERMYPLPLAISRGCPTAPHSGAASPGSTARHRLRRGRRGVRRRGARQDQRRTSPPSGAMARGSTLHPRHGEAQQPFSVSMSWACAASGTTQPVSSAWLDPENRSPRSTGFISVAPVPRLHTGSTAPSLDRST